MATAPPREPRELVASAERLLESLDDLPDAEARATAIEVVQALLELYGAGLERIVQEIAARDREGEIAEAFAADELIAHLLLLHGLHPLPLEQRVADALDEVRPYLESHGGNVELLAVGGTTVRLRLQGSCSGCPSSTITLKLAIENAIQKLAPEIEEVLAEEEPARAPLLQIEMMPARSEPALGADWTMVGGLRDVTPGRTAVKDVSGQRILFTKVGELAYAYRPSCPRCGHSLDGLRLSGVRLTCPGCQDSYDVMRAGRGLDSPQLHLEPVPLLVGDDGLVKLALAAPGAAP